MTGLGKAEFDATQGSEGEGVQIRAGKDTQLLALLEVSGVKQGEGITAEHREKRELRKFLC